MKPNFRTCPQCSTRNRLDKEFCVKCGESLEGVQVAKEPAGSEAKKGKLRVLIAEGAEEQSMVVPVISFALTVGVAFAGWRYVRAADAPPALPPTLRASSTPSQNVGPPTSSTLQEAGSADYQAGMAALRAGDFETAVRRLRLAVGAASNRAEYRLGLADALEKSGVPSSEYLPEFEAAAQIDTSNARYVSEWARALNRAGRNSDAIRVFESAIQLDASNLANLKELANLLMRANDLTRARPILEKVVALQPDDLAPKQDLARALENAHDLDGAVKQYKEILTSMPAAHMSRALLAEIYMKQDNAAAALALLNEGITLDPSAALMFREKGRVLDRTGKSAEAVAAYTEYIKLAPGASDLKIFRDRIEQLTAVAEQQS